MSLSDGKLAAVLLAYALSLATAFAVTPSFAVMNGGDFLLFGLYALSLPAVLLFVLAKERRGGVVAAVHIVLAVLIHPAVLLAEEEPVRGEDQIEMLRAVQAAKEPWRARVDAAYALSRSLKYDAMTAYRIQNPTLYWVSPPSLVLAVWGILSFVWWPRLHSLE